MLHIIGKNKTKYQFNIVCLENKVQIYQWVMVMVFNVISWGSALLLEETGENHRPVASH